MKLDEAIEIKQRRGDELQNTFLFDIYEADMLSIEALKELQRLRASSDNDPTIMLPGETEK